MRAKVVRLVSFAGFLPPHNLLCQRLQGQGTKQPVVKYHHRNHHAWSSLQSSPSSLSYSSSSSHHHYHHRHDHHPSHQYMFTVIKVSHQFSLVCRCWRTQWKRPRQFSWMAFKNHSNSTTQNRICVSCWTGSQLSGNCRDHPSRWLHPPFDMFSRLTLRVSFRVTHSSSNLPNTILYSSYQTISSELSTLTFKVPTTANEEVTLCYYVSYRH